MSVATLKKIEAAINEKNYGRMYEIGVSLIDMARNDDAWFEAVVVIGSYLVKNNNHIWNAVDLSKRGALVAREGSEVQMLLMTSLTTNIEALPTAKDRAEAAATVAAVAPKNSIVMAISLDLILTNVPQIDSNDDKIHYLRIVIQYSPECSAVKIRANILIQRLPKSKPVWSKKKQEDRSPLLGFLDRHKGNISDLFMKDEQK